MFPCDRPATLVDLRTGRSARLSADGTALLYSTYIGSFGSEIGQAVAVQGDFAYVGGLTASAGFPTTFGAYDRTYNTSIDGFVVRLELDDTDGTPSQPGDSSDLEYSTFLGGSLQDEVHGIAVDIGGGVTIVGEARLNFPTTTGAFDTTLDGSVDGFVARLVMANGGTNDLVYSSYLGGGGDDFAYAVALDSFGVPYVAGETVATVAPVFPTTSGAYDTTPNGRDAFLVKIDTIGTDGLLYGTLLGGTSTDQALGLAVDGAGDAYLTGQTNSFNFPAVSAVQANATAVPEAFVARISPDGLGSSDLVWSTFLGGGGGGGGGVADFGAAVAVDAVGNTYAVGFTNSKAFPTTVGAYSTRRAGGGPGTAGADGWAVKIAP